MGDRKRGMIQDILGPDPREEKEGADDAPSIEICASELIDAIHAKDIRGVVEALKACFREFDSEPHEEGPHTEE